MKPVEVADRLRDRFPDVLLARDEVTVIVDREDLLSSLATLRDDPNLSFDFLSCVTAADWPDTIPDSGSSTSCGRWRRSTVSA